MKYRVPVNPSVPRGMEAAYANEAVRQAESRLAAESARREAERLRQQQQQAALEEIKAATAKRQAAEAEAARQKSRERFEADLRARFLAATPGASENDWNRNKTAVIDAAMQQATFGRGPVADLVAKKRASGLYVNL